MGDDVGCSMGIFLMGMVIGLMIGGTTFGLIMEISNNELIISEETAQDICNGLMNTTDIEYKVEDKGRKLICTKPSFDNTQNIVLK